MLGIKETITLDKDYPVVLIPLSPIHSYTIEDIEVEELSNRIEEIESNNSMSEKDLLAETDKLFVKSEALCKFKLTKIIVQDSEGIIAKAEELQLLGILLQECIKRVKQEKKAQSKS